MDMRQAFRARLIDGAAIDAPASSHVHWNARPQGEGLSAIMLHVISAPRARDMKGAQAVQWARVQADCLADDYEEALAIAKRVVALIEPSAVKGGVRFRAASIEGPVDRGERTETGFVHRQQVDLMFFYSEL